MNQPTVIMCTCRTKYRHQKRTWANEYPLSELDGWIDFYRRLSKKKPKIYGPDLRALTLFKALEVST